MLSRSALVVLPVLLSACGADTSPVWAVDTLYVEPTEDGIYALQSWEIFGDRWARRFNERHYVCAVVVELEGSASEDCSDCVYAWEVTGQRLETDCEDWFVAEAAFPVTTGIGLASLPEALVDDDPWPGTSAGGFVAYDDGSFIPHGWAYPEALDNGAEPVSRAWDDSESFVWWPAYAWEIRQSAE